tara:strand:+ start:607 stop:1572 length:966 start_codon:yes stop_codon:yes gene_type:complete
MKNIYTKKNLEKLYLIRLVEEEIARRYKKEKMRCPVHLSIGQESCAVGVCSNLKNEDIVFSNHRSHAHYLAKGGNVQKMIDEIHGNENGCIGGRGGSMHLQDISKNFFASIPIVSSSVGLATGTAFAQMRRKKNSITCVFTGDATMDEGIVHESLNFSSIFNLPILYVCENNYYSIFTHVRDRQTSSDFTRFARSHKIKSARVNGNKLDHVMKATEKAIKYIKKNKKPFFLQLDTYRFLQHCGPSSDDNLNYRDKKELNYWFNLDPIKYYEKLLVQKKILTLKDLRNNKFQMKKVIKKIFDKSENTKLPNPNLASKYVYKN